MKSFAILLFLLATALSSAALSTPNYHVRRQILSGNGTGTDKDSICAGSSPTLLSTSTLLADNTTIELSEFSCAPSSTSPFVAAHRGGGLFGWLDGLLWWLLPHPHPPPKPSTTTKTTTKTVTSVSVSVSVSESTATVTATVTSTASAVTPTPTPADVCGEICTTVCGELGTLPPTTEDCQQLVNAITILNGQIPPNFTVESNHVQTISFGTCRFFFENVSPQQLSYCWLSLAQVASAAASACLPPNQPVLSEGLCIPSSGLWEVGVAHA